MESQGNRLERARKKAGFKTATAAAKRFGWTYTTYKSHENGQTNNIPVEDAIAYAAAFKVTPEWISYAVGDIDDTGIDQLLRDKPGKLKKKARRLVEGLLAEEEE